MNEIKKEQEDDSMSNNSREINRISISDSVIEAFNEVKEMREGKTPKHSLEELFSNIEEWRK